MKDTEVTNVIMMVHGWQHDGHQKDLFYDHEEEYKCPAGCGEKEGRMHYVQCKAQAMKECYMKRKLTFLQMHKKLKTAGSIADAFSSILKDLRNGGDEPERSQLFLPP